MGFTTAAFIRKNTPELRKKLEELGYKCSSLRCDRSCLYTASCLNVYHSVHPEWLDNKDICKTNDIDCGDNEDLFLAIAALRDDIDIHQWFTDGKDWAYHPKTSYCSPCVTIYKTLAFDHIPEDFKMENYHKATVEELIEHFRGKEE
jgi:hypothetical protein